MITTPRQTSRRTIDITLFTAAIALAGCASGPPVAPTLAAPSAEPRVDAGTIDSRPVLEAEAILVQALHAEYALLRANAIEALQHTPEAIEPALPSLLHDRNRGVRFVAAMTVGQLRLRAMADAVEPLLDDEHPSVQAAAIFALRSCGRSVDPSPLAAMLRSTDPEVKGNAAFVIGRLGNRSALQLLHESLRWAMPRASHARQRIVELQVAEAMVLLGAEKEIDVIRAALFAPPEEGEITALAAQMAGKLGDEQYAPTLQQIATREGRMAAPAEVRLAAVAALGRMNPRAAPAHVALTYARHEEPAIRAQAALALAYLPVGHADDALAHLLRDDDPMVQVSAAGAILMRSTR